MCVSIHVVQHKQLVEYSVPQFDWSDVVQTALLPPTMHLLDLVGNNGRQLGSSCMTINTTK